MKSQKPKYRVHVIKEDMDKKYYNTQRILNRFIDIMRLVVKNENLGVSDIARKIGWSHSTVANDLRLIKKKMPEVDCIIRHFICYGPKGCGTTHKKIYRWMI